MTELSVAEYLAVGSVLVNVGVAFVALKMSNEIGKSEARVKEDVRQVELFMRDNFVLKEDYRDMVHAMNTSMDAQFNRVYSELARILDRMDRNGSGG